MEAKIDLFPLSPKARNMLLRLFGIDPDEALTYHGVCRPCLLLPVDERNELAENAIKSEEDEFRHALIRRRSMRIKIETRGNHEPRSSRARA